jgi:hypothetical protein
MSGFTRIPDVRQRAYASGGYYYFEGPAFFQGGAAGSIGQVRLTPGFLHAPVTISEFGAGVTTLAAAGNFQALLYAADPVTNLPTGAPLIQTGNLSTASTGMIKQTGLSKALPPGLYWCGVQADNATAAFTAINGSGPFVPQVVGVLAGSTFGIGGSSGQTTGLIKAGTFNSPPTMTGVWANDGWSVDTGAVASCCFFRAT